MTKKQDLNNQSNSEFVSVLYSNHEDDSSTVVEVRISNGEMQISTDNRTTNDNHVVEHNRYSMRNICAQDVMKHIGGENYEKMLARIQELFHEETAATDLISFLQFHHVGANNPKPEQYRDAKFSAQAHQDKLCFSWHEEMVDPNGLYACVTESVDHIVAESVRYAFGTQNCEEMCQILEKVVKTHNGYCNLINLLRDNGII